MIFITHNLTIHRYRAAAGRYGRYDNLDERGDGGGVVVDKSAELGVEV